MNKEEKKIEKEEKKDFYKQEPGNLPCKTCGKPTRSHHDNWTGDVQCHVCWLEENEGPEEEEE